MSEKPPPRQPGDCQSCSPGEKNSKNPAMRTSDESESDISNAQSVNAEGSGFDADGELSDITVRERKKRERKMVRISATKKKRSPNSKKIVTPKKNEPGSGHSAK